MRNSLVHHHAVRFSLTIQEKDEADLRPVFTEDGITYIYIKVRSYRKSSFVDFE